MEDISVNIEIWKKELGSFHFPTYDNIPDLGLYMDQVVGYLEQKLSMFEGSSKSITSAMINNYVKQGIVPAPEKKKYYKNHFACLFIIYILKQVLSINEISKLMYAHTNLDLEQFYFAFCKAVEHSLKSVIEHNTDEQSYKIALSEQDNLVVLMSANSFATKIYAQKIIDLYYVCPTDDQKDEKEREKAKKEEEKRKEKERKEKEKEKNKENEKEAEEE